VLAGVHGERAALGQPPLAARERVGVEQGRGRISVDGPAGVDPVIRQIDAAGQLSRSHEAAW
jgi:hypothetical protein